VILVAGGIADSVTELVCARLTACGYPYRLLDLARYPSGHGLAVRWTDAGPQGHLSGPDWTLDLDEISAVYVRFIGPEGRLPLPNVPPAAAAELKAEADIALMTLFEDLPCAVVNRLAGGMSNNSKPYQSLLLARAGFKVPPTLVTSDPDAARAFIAAHGEVIYKSASGIRSIVRRLGHGQLARLDLLLNGPAQFQAFIPGHNVRVHTVGETLFATRVVSEAVDYRYARRDGQAVEMEATELPPEVARSCRRIARELGLLHAGIDLKTTPDGDWFCFEVNPCPGFLYYERNTGQPISAALAELLYHGRTVQPEPTREAAAVMS
jgi:glutathione synthase/RimK-type ligase-like ATP-grasp enzyme